MALQDESRHILNVAFIADPTVPGGAYGVVETDLDIDAKSASEREAVAETFGIIERHLRAAPPTLTRFVVRTKSAWERTLRRQD